jgi:hypothetical protein
MDQKSYKMYVYEMERAKYHIYKTVYLLLQYCLVSFIRTNYLQFLYHPNS